MSIENNLPETGNNPPPIEIADITRLVRIKIALLLQIAKQAGNGSENERRSWDQIEEETLRMHR